MRVRMRRAMLRALRVTGRYHQGEKQAWPSRSHSTACTRVRELAAASPHKPCCHGRGGGTTRVCTSSTSVATRIHIASFRILRVGLEDIQKHLRASDAGVFSRNGAMYITKITQERPPSRTRTDRRCACIDFTTHRKITS